MKIPDTHQMIMPYLIVDGAEKFLQFTQKVFNARETFKMMREDGKKIMHAEIQIGGSTIMFADTPDNAKPQTAGLFIYAENVDGTYEKAINQGGTTLREPSDQDYGRTCGVTDPFGNIWWITSFK